MITRRSFFLGVGAALAAPAIVRAESLMRVVMPKMRMRRYRGAALGRLIYGHLPGEMRTAVAWIEASGSPTDGLMESFTARREMAFAKRDFMAEVISEKFPQIPMTFPRRGWTTGSDGLVALRPTAWPANWPTEWKGIPDREWRRR